MNDVRFDIVFRSDGKIDASCQIEGQKNETIIWQSLNPDSLEHEKVAKAKAAIDALLPGLIEAASQTDEIASLKAQLEAKDAQLESKDSRITELEASEVELNELKAKIEAL